MATAFDNIYLQPSGSVGLTGLISNTPFVRGTLDKLGIIPRIGRREEYKTLVNRLTEKKYTDAHRESSLPDRIHNQGCAPACAPRGTPGPRRVRCPPPPRGRPAGGDRERTVRRASPGASPPSSGRRPRGEDKRVLSSFPGGTPPRPRGRNGRGSRGSSPP